MESIKSIKLKNKLALSFISVFLLVQCQSQKKAEYELPEAMLPHVKVFYKERCEKGKILYDLSCANCHNYKVKGKKIIPDFTPAQLTGYTIRVSNAQHEKSMPDSIVTEEELGIIMTFLEYKKPNTPLKPCCKNR